ncbi:MAG: phosphoribosylglycinamide synthetase [Gammaproteobacteria bacterium]|nr:MAG: phosphoribosylglycinamide synthetase [Gammaproteobacteria bacterium]
MSHTLKKRLLLISHHNSYRIAPYIKAALKLDLEISIASEGKQSLVTEVANGIHINFDDKTSALATVLKEHNKSAFSGVLGSDDHTVELAAHIAKVLHLPHNPPQAAQYSHRKDLARERLTLAGCPIPIYCLLDLDLPLTEQIKDISWPCVLKPLNMSASRGVIRVNNKDECLIACKRLKAIITTASGSFEQTHVLLEEYIDGIEIAYEGYLHKDVLNTITVFDKPDPLTGPYFEETIYVTPSALSKDLQHSIKNVIQKACRIYGLTTGAIHAECRIDNNDKVWILEIASRTIGGDCARILDSENFSVEELAISLAIDQPIDVAMLEQARGVMMLPVREKGLLKRVEGLLEATRVAHIDKIDIIINQGHELVPLPEGNQYLGYIFASSKTPGQVTSAIREAYAKLKFITAPIFTIH